MAGYLNKRKCFPHKNNPSDKAPSKQGGSSIDPGLICRLMHFLIVFSPGFNLMFFYLWADPHAVPSVPC